MIHLMNYYQKNQVLKNKESNMKEKIDFVILWVDPTDENWLKEKNKYLNVTGDKSNKRFRDFDNLKYLFRGIERFAPFVNKVFFVTFGHLPKWLNVNSDKLVIVNHKDYMKEEYLPTFNSNVIELNLGNIEELSEHFVLLNDDIFILNNLKEEDFFINGKPNDMYVEYKKKNPSNRSVVMHKNYFDILDKYFDKEEFVKSNKDKIINKKYGIKNIYNLKSMKNKSFLDLYSAHLNQNLLKSTFNTLWLKEYSLLDKASKNKFRSNSDIGQMLMRYYNLLSGNFNPKKPLGKYFEISNNNKNIINAIKSQKYKMICINDAKDDIDFEKSKNEINSALESVLNKKSSFEI